MHQHVVLINTNQLREDPSFPVDGSLLANKGRFERVIDRHDPLDRLVSVTGAVNWDGRDRQSCASPRASSNSPRPLGRVGLQITEDPSRNRWREENSVNESPWDVVKTTPDLGDGDVTHPSRILTGATILGGGGVFPRGDGGGTGSRGIFERMVDTLGLCKSDAGAHPLFKTLDVHKKLAVRTP